jgi:hypothetical protein
MSIPPSRDHAGGGNVMFELKTEHIFDARFTVTSPDG